MSGERVRLPPAQRDAGELSGRDSALPFVRECTVVVVDESASMLEQDYPPDRFRAGLCAGRVYTSIKAEERPESLVGLVTFSSKYRIIMKPVLAARALRAWQGKTRRLGPNNGTDLEAGLKGANRLLRWQNKACNKRIILLTDGHGGDPSTLANSLKKRGVVIDTIGIGGSPEDVNEHILKKIASIVDGDTRYRFIADAEALFRHFRRIAGGIVKPTGNAERR